MRSTMALPAISLVDLHEQRLKKYQRRCSCKLSEDRLFDLYQARSNRSKFMTLTQAFTKSCTNFARASSLP